MRVNGEEDLVTKTRPTVHRAQPLVEQCPYLSDFRVRFLK